MSREHQSKLNKEIAIYWDYERVILPQRCGHGDAAKQIYKSVSKYGRVVERRLYFDFKKYNGTGPLDCNELDLSGFDLVNTPTRDARETLDKKLIADVLTFAWDCTARKTEPCVVLITSDSDYAYTLGKLRARGVMNVVIFGKDCSLAHILMENSDVSLSFEKDVLNSSVESKNSSSFQPPMGGATLAYLNLFFKNLPAMENVKEFVEFIEKNQKAVVRRAIMFGSDASYKYAHVFFMNANDGSKVLNAACDGGMTFRGRKIHVSINTNIPSEDTFAKTQITYRYEKQPHQPSTRWGTMHISHESSLPQQPYTRWNNKQTSWKLPESAQIHVTTTLKDITKCCICLHNEQLSRTTIHAADIQEYQKCWIPMNSFNGPLQLSNCSLSKAEVKCIVDKSIFEGYITVTRKDVKSALYASVPWHKNRGVRNCLSQEAYLRLTMKGRTLVQTTFQEKNVNEFLGFGLKDPIETSSTSDGERTSPLSQVHLQFANLPNGTTVAEFVEFIENEYVAVVKRALVVRNLMDIGDKTEATATKDINCCSANVLLANPQCGLMIAFLALTNGISFNGTQIKIKLSSQACFDSMLEEMADSEDYKCYYPQIKNISQEALDIPISDDNRLSVSIAKSDFCSCLLKEQKVIGNTELLPCDKCWVPYSIIGTKSRSLVLFSNLPTENCKELLKVIREFSLVDGLIEIGRQKLDGNRGYVNVPWSNDRGSSDTLSREFYLRLTGAGISLLQSTKLMKKKIVDNLCSKGEEPGIAVNDAIVENAIVKGTNLEVFKKTAIAAQGADKIEKAEYLNNCSNGRIETTTSRRAIFPKELNEAIEAKDYTRAAAIQADIVNVENNDISSGDRELIAVLQGELDQELCQVVKVKKFAKAAIIQGHIDALEKGSLSADKVKSLLMEHFNTELSNTIKAKDFVKAATIQGRIERLEQKNRE